jgi:hypothetical protein
MSSDKSVDNRAPYDEEYGVNKQDQLYPGQGTPHKPAPTQRKIEDDRCGKHLIWIFTLPIWLPGFLIMNIIVFPIEFVYGNILFMKNKVLKIIFLVLSPIFVAVMIPLGVLIAIPFQMVSNVMHYLRIYGDWYRSLIKRNFIATIFPKGDP